METSTYPPAHRVVDLRMADGALVRLREHGNPVGPRLVLSHGNGLAIAGYQVFWERLLARYQLILFDFRNHGVNPLHGPQGHNWPTFVRDLEAVWQGIGHHFGARRAAGVFHSMSAVCALLHALEYGPRFDALALFDPPLSPLDEHPLYQLAQSSKQTLTARTLRRTPSYASPEELAAQFASRAPFRRWRPPAYLQMARATLRRDPAADRTDRADRADRWILACPRELEAAIFGADPDRDLWTKLKRLPPVVKLICGDPTLPEAESPTLAGRALADEGHMEYEAISDTTHFLQLEAPERCIAAMEALLARHGLAAA